MNLPSTPQQVGGRKVLVRVKQEHIERGVQGSMNKNPVTLAMADQGFPHAVVGSLYELRPFALDSESPYRQVAYEVPSVGRFIRLYDFNRPVKSFEFELELPTEEA